MTIDLRDFDTREHASTGYGLSPVEFEQPDEESVDRIRAALTLQKYQREVAERESSK